MTTKTSPLVLLVEDNPDHADLVRQTLATPTQRPRLEHVRDGEQALDYLLRRGAFQDPASSPRPEVILLDIRLPKRDGLSVLREIKANPSLREIPVVILTTSSHADDVSAAYQGHANSYLVKPVDYGEFSALMRDLGVYLLDRNHQA